MDLLDSGTEWQHVQRLPHAVIYKHSPICGLSTRAMPEVERFAEARPEVPLFMVDVIRHRGLSRQIAGDLGVRHESPQVIVLADGSVTWHASHHAVSTEGILGAMPS